MCISRHIEIQLIIKEGQKINFNSVSEKVMKVRKANLLTYRGKRYKYC